MPRPRRIEIEDGIYHLYNRFVGGKSFFCSTEIVRKFKEIFYSTAEYFDIKVLVYECMPNHFHSIIKIPGRVLSKFIQKYSTQFARVVNKRYNRHGHVFQGRHKTQLIDTDKYLLTAVAYIFYNSVRAGIVSRVKEYQWSNYNEIIEENNNPDYDIIYHQFHKDREKGRLAFKDWMERIDVYQNRDKFYRNLKGQFLMDGVYRAEVLKKVDRRIESGVVEKERRKEHIRYRHYTADEVEDMLRNYEPALNDWQGLWRSEVRHRQHLKWYLLRNYCRLSLVEISIREKQMRHTTISEALRRIDSNKNKMDCIQKVIQRLEMNKEK